MPKETLYLKLERNVELMQEEIRMKDLGRFACRDEKILNRVKVLLVARFDPKKDGGRKVISVMYLIKKLTKEFPDLEVQSIGESGGGTGLHPKTQKRMGVLKNLRGVGHLLFRSGLYDHGLSQRYQHHSCL